MLYILIISTLISQSFSDTIINISWGQLDTSKNIPFLPHFWTSTGFSPISIHGGNCSSLSTDENINLALIGSLPRDSITHVRIHWLLDLVTARRNGDVLDFDFSSLDAMMTLLHRYNLYPGFELMGNPSGIFFDFEENLQQRWWKKLVTSLTERYITKYGLNQVKHWRFESWNEPDLKMYNTLNFTLKSFEAYFLASVDGLLEASGGELLLGGPAGLFRTPRNKHPLCWGLLDMVSQRKDVHLAFISLHRKGNASSQLIVQETLQLVRIFKQRYPTLRHLPLANDEADPLKGWWHNEAWRADARYAAMLARNAIDHLNLMVRRRDFAMKFISNDNAFLSMNPHYFTQRTLLARFQMNNTQQHHTQFFLKPVYVVLALMSLLGERDLPLQISPPDSRIATLAAGTWHKDNSFSAALLIVCNNETKDNPNVILTFNITLPISEWSLTSDETRFSIFVLDNIHTNPSSVWEQAGKPNFPNSTLRKVMRHNQEYRPVLSQVLPESGKLTLSLHFPSVALLQLCTRFNGSPGLVTGLHGLHVTHGEVLLLWRDSHVGTRCLLRYEIEFRVTGQQHFNRINIEDNSILLNFHYQIEDLSTEVFGDYRVRAIDLWSRPGPYSQIYRYSGDA